MACGVATFESPQYYGLTEPGSLRSEELGEPFENVKPDGNGEFDLELGVILPDLFPALNGCLEYSVEVTAESISPQRLAVSNLMSRLWIPHDGISVNAIAHRYFVDRLGTEEFPDFQCDFAEEPVRTFVTTRYKIRGITAAVALDDHISDKLDNFITLLNKLLRTFSLADDGNPTIYSTAYARSTFDCVYFVIGEPKDPKCAGRGRLMPHVGRTNLNPAVWPTDLSNIVRDQLSGVSKPSDINTLLHDARRYLEVGSLKFSVLLSVIAAETATAQFARERLLALGASKKKLDEYEKDYKFSMLLNVEIFALTPIEHKPDRELLGKINSARNMRNGLMHKGEDIKEKRRASEVLKDCETYIKYIEVVRQYYATLKCTDQSSNGGN